MKTGKDDEHCPKVNACRVCFRRTVFGWNSTWACGWAWPGLCGKLLGVADSDRSTLQCQHIPKDCTQKDMTIKRKRNIAMNLQCEEIIVETLCLM